MQRLLEGELILHKGVVYIVKGFQHPRNYVIAYPRYNMLTLERIHPRDYYKYTNLSYWKCIDYNVPLIPLEQTYPYNLHYCGINSRARYLRKFLSEISGIDEEDIYITGSYRVCLFNEETSDVDLIVYGNRNVDKIYKVLKDLRENRITRPLSNGSLLIEYHKHKDLRFKEYEILRSNSVLQGVFLNKIRYSIRLVPYVRGFNKCVEKTKFIGFYRLKVRIVDYIQHYTTPAKYVVEVIKAPSKLSLILKKKIHLITYRLRYTELPLNTILNGVFRVEALVSNNTVRIVPDYYPVKPCLEQ